MRIRIGIIVAYLLLGCILLEDALPYFADSNTIEMCESKTESSEKETKKEKELEDEWLVFKEKLPVVGATLSILLIHPGSILADSDVIPDSAHQSIFTPPPDRA